MLQSRRPTLSPNIWLPYRTGRIGQRARVLLLKSNGSSGLWMVQDEGGDRGWGLCLICEKKAQLSTSQIHKSFQAEIYAILACVYEIQSLDMPQKQVSICSDCQAALKSLQANRRTSLLVQQCQKAVNEISNRIVVGSIGSLDNLGYEVTRSMTRAEREATFEVFLGPEPALWISRRDVQHRFNRWLVNQHEPDGEDLVVPKDTLENLSRNLIWIPRLSWCPSTGLSPG
jgi:hypothetical protein